MNIIIIFDAVNCNMLHSCTNVKLHYIFFIRIYYSFFIIDCVEGRFCFNNVQIARTEIIFQADEKCKNTIF